MSESENRPNEIDYKQYTENPQEFFIIINNLTNLSNKEYEYAQYLLEDMINYQQEKFSSENIKLCKYYNKYIDVLIKKFFDNEYLNSFTNENEILFAIKYFDDIYDFCKEYLEKCIKIYSNYLEKYKNSDVKDLNNEIKDYFLELSEVYRNYAIIEKEERNFNTAIVFFDKSINLKIKYFYKENKFNKNLLSIFIEKSTCFINNPHYYLVCLYKIKCIIDILISNEIKKNNNNNLNEIFELPEKNFLEIEKINANDKKLFLNNEIIKNEKFKKLCDSNENLNNLMFYYEKNNEKIKDDIEEIFAYEEFKKKYGEDFIKNEYNKDFFDNKINMNEIQNINNNLIKRKKRISMENDFELEKIKENAKNDFNKKKYI